MRFSRVELTFNDNSKLKIIKDSSDYPKLICEKYIKEIENL